MSNKQSNGFSVCFPSDGVYDIDPVEKKRRELLLAKVNKVFSVLVAFGHNTAFNLFRYKYVQPTTIVFWYSCTVGHFYRKLAER